MGKKKIKAQKEIVETRNSNLMNLALTDPAFASYIGLGGVWSDGLTVSEYRALGIPAYYRAVSIVAGTIAGLPMKTYRRIDEETRERIPSFLDNPAGPYPLTPFAWKELVMLHLLNWGEAFLMHIYNGAGATIGLWPVHPSMVSVEWIGADKTFKVDLGDGTQQEFDTADMTHIMAMTTDGLRGIAPITMFRRAIQLGMAGEDTALKSFTEGMLVSGIVTPREGDITEADAKVIKTSLQQNVLGSSNAGSVAIVNRSLQFTPWSMNNVDAQFLESRQFQVEEFARMLGVPAHLLGAQEKQTSWGTGVAEQNLGLARYTLMAWTSRIEESLSTLLTSTKFVEFDYKGLLQGTPSEEIDILIKQVNAGLLTKDEARGILNRGPLPPDANNNQGGGMNGQ